MNQRTVNIATISPCRDRAKKFWRRAMKQFAGGGQSIGAFCAARESSEPSFHA